MPSIKYTAKNILSGLLGFEESKESLREQAYFPNVPSRGGFHYRQYIYAAYDSKASYTFYKSAEFGHKSIYAYICESIAALQLAAWLL